MIFDWDNTLFDYHGYWLAAHKIFYENSPRLKKLDSFDNLMETYLSYDKKLWPDVSAGKISLDELRYKRNQLTAQKYGIDLTKAESQDIFSKIFDILIEQIVPQDALLERLKKLRNKNIYILTNGSEVEQTAKLKKANFYQEFPTYISEIIGYEKPSLLAFKHVFDANNINPLDSVMIGDSKDNDILPANNLGLLTVHIGPRPCKEARFNFSTIDELLDVLEN